jgi:hypothetical protein
MSVKSFSVPLSFVSLSELSQIWQMSKGREVEGKGSIGGNARKETYFDIFHPLSLIILFALGMLTPHRLVTTISNFGKWDNSANAFSVTPGWNRKNRDFKYENTVLSSLAFLFQSRMVSSFIIDVWFADEDEPLMLRETRLGRVERQCREDVVSVIEDTRVREVR